ncbi:acyl-homoserine-lactone synthase [Acetobacter indonesiensis]|uniref:acyl-homoserine-lactone synthase n=1 Tax=Acetobacter indonesiensis TaxID=104101 RepID=UPI000A3C5660|nr:acyl-homoserine-lactone synthase [Acetobacter indonesiensis]
MLYQFSYVQRHAFSKAYAEMLNARAAVCQDRPEWAAHMRYPAGEDVLDHTCNPVYFVSMDEAGRHMASMRIMPTTGDTVLRHNFRDVFINCPDITSPDVWEYSLFCSSVDTTTPSGRYAAADVTKAVCRRALESGIRQIVGVYDTGLFRIARRLGWEPSTIATDGDTGELLVGVWDVTPLTLRHIAELQLLGV